MTGFERLLTGHLLCERYRIDEVIGRGGMGAVYRATDTRLEREVAVKVVTVAVPDAEARARVRARFHREARAAARLQHPNVVAVHDFGTDPRLDLDFLVMELLRGEDLAARLARGRLALPEALHVLREAARGLAAGHRAGLVHRDVKPGNLFLERDPHGGSGTRVRVLDFGIVQWAGDDAEHTRTQLTIAGHGPHSPAYAAPEQLRGEPDLTAACDVYALGITAFQMLAGVRPFSEAEQQRLAAGAPLPVPSLRALNPAIPAGVEWVVRTALATRPADRFRDAGALDAALAETVDGREATLLDAPTPAPRAAPPAPPAPAPHADATWLDPAPAPRPAPAAPPPWAGATAEGTVLAPASIPRPPLAADDADRRALEALRAQMAPPARPSWLRRTGHALWQLALTVAAGAAAALLWAALRDASAAGLTEPFYASVVGLTVTVPWFAHRVTGRRGSYRWALIAAAGVAFAVFRFFQPLAGMEATVAVLPLAQLAAAGWVLRLTRRTPAPPVAG